MCKQMKVYEVVEAHTHPFNLTGKTITIATGALKVKGHFSSGMSIQLYAPFYGLPKYCTDHGKLFVCKKMVAPILEDMINEKIPIPYIDNYYDKKFDKIYQ